MMWVVGRRKDRGERGEDISGRKKEEAWMREMGGGKREEGGRGRTRDEVPVQENEAVD